MSKQTTEVILLKEYSTGGYLSLGVHLKQQQTESFMV
jgi:hypothetical protein